MSRLPRRATGARREVTLRTALALLSGATMRFYPRVANRWTFNPLHKRCYARGGVIGVALTDL